MQEEPTPRRRRRLRPEDKWQVFLEASAKDVKVADVLRRWGIDSSQLARIRRLGRPQSFVSKYETGERRLDLIEIRDVCQACGIELITLVERFEQS
jgi:transposase-like protein